MTQKESSATSSLRRLQLEQELQNFERVRLAQLRDRQQATLRTVVCRAEPARPECCKRDAQRATAERCSEDERPPRDQDIETARVMPESDLKAKVQRMQLEQAQSMQRLALERDSRLRRVEGQRAMLASLLATLLIGSLGVWALLLQPQLEKSEETVKQLTIERAAARSELQQQRASYQAQISNLESRNRNLQSQLTVPSAPPPSITSPGHGSRLRPPTSPAKTANKQITCDAQDPLCGDLG